MDFTPDPTCTFNKNLWHAKRRVAEAEEAVFNLTWMHASDNAHAFEPNATIKTREMADASLLRLHDAWADLLIRKVQLLRTELPVLIPDATPGQSFIDFMLSGVIEQIEIEKAERAEAAERQKREALIERMKEPPTSSPGRCVPADSRR